ncbi:MAG: hypothetical protein A2077_02920 [Nitrospirae bacterium GWC2_46_6]|nr:MAG: hypothetical protein A2077_02920 [Nitrospirae bacterium GWC2_46_6]OGW21706.1 MAG: hypothetical protein A2Z82_03650 [Nitrospirae bacterium GWA2_46_11]OGW23620.1 MAG: hypothetical protein A2X55_03295 [Nitrospirae bacterium GWB2_47_37]HAK88115.1 chemotaxis protein [Nitrospiraceae bacterium]
MNIKDMSLKWKVAVPIIAMVSVGIIITIIVTTSNTRRIVIDEAQHTTLPGYRDTVLNTLTTMMITGNVKDAKGPFLEQMKNIVDLRVIRTDTLDKDYGKGGPDEYAKDDIEKKVIENGNEQVVIEGDYIRGVYPYIAKSNFMGKNCLSCHNVKEGTVLGAISIKVPLTESLGKIRSSRNLYFGLGLMGILSVAVSITLLVRMALKPLFTLKKRVDEITNGDLRVSIEAESKDEIGMLALDMNRMIQSFNNMINNILGSSNNVVSSVDILRARSQKTADGAKSQSGQAHQIATAAEEMSQTITDIARNAAVASDTSAEAMDVANTGKDVADNAVETINRVYTSTVELATMVEKLNNRAAEIGDIITVIKDIADQTNLLALNAAIEAARAGEQGRGFAVVADEVRKLAERTIKATVEISGKIEAVQAESTQTTKSMEEASGEVTRATELIRGVGETLNHIVESVQKVRDQITQIATAVDEQSAASEEVARNIEKTSSISKDMEKMSEDVMHQVNALTKIAEELRNSTAGFKTKGSELMILDIAKSDHRVFVGKIASCLKGDTKLDPSQLPDHHNCRFGKWYFSEGMQMCGTLPSFKSLDEPHAKVHSMAKEAVSACNSGDKMKAERIYNEMEDISDQIGSLLDGIKRECR